MMDEGGITNDHPANRLNLIDMSSEDDSLLYSRLNDFTGHRSEDNQKKDQSSELLEAVNDEDKLDYFEKWEHQSPQLYQPLEPVSRKSGKHQYNMRKSLAWDSAFFTGAGVLDPEELSSMIGGVEKVEKCSLHAIQEDLQNSDDSIPGLESDCLSIENADTNLFEDVRASIQNSAKVANATNWGDKSRSGEADTSIVLPSERKGCAARNKMEDAAASKKTSIHKLVPGRLVKQASASSKVSQPKVLDKLGSTSSALTKRVSLVNNLVRATNDEIEKNASGKGSTRSKATTSANSRTSVHESVSTVRGVHSSSVESSGAATSENNKSASSTKRNTVPRTSKTQAAGSTGKASSSAASRADCQSGKSRPSNYLISVTKHSSGASPVSSISEWSSDLSSCYLENSSRTSLDTSSIVGEASEVLETVDHADDRYLGAHATDAVWSLNEYIKKGIPGSTALSAVSAKPSSLRLPSPKIGFFDGKSGNMKHLPVSRSLPKGRSGNTTSSGGINKTKDGKVQPARTIMAIRSTKPDIPQTSVVVNLKSFKPYPRNSNDTNKNKNSGTNRNVRSGQGISQGIQHQLPSSLPQMKGKCQMEVEEAFAQRFEIEDGACKYVKLDETNI